MVKFSTVAPFCCVFAAMAGNAFAQEAAPIPDIAQALLDAAYETGDPEEIAAVRKAVLKVFPDYADAVNADAEAQIAALAPPPETTDATPPDAAPTDAGGIFALKPWKGKIQAGASFASGNSDNLAAGLNLDAARDTGDFVHNVSAFIDFAESNGETNQKRWGGAYQLDYQFTEETYAYGRVSYEEDQFSGFSYRVFSGAGLGHYLYLSEPFTWKIEGGPGFRYSLIDNSPETEEEVAFYASTELDWIIRDGVVFEQDVNATWTSPTTTIQSITSLKTDLTDSLAIALSYEYRFETDPPPDIEKTDQVARASLVYGF